VSDQRRFGWRSGGLTGSPISGFWAITLDTKDPQIPNLPLETPATSGVTHPTNGVLAGQSATIAGVAARTRIHAAIGALAGPGSSVAGAAARTRLHATAGIMAGQGSGIAGTAAHIVIHATSGVMAGSGSAVSGTALRIEVYAGGAASRQRPQVPVSHADAKAHRVLIAMRSNVGLPMDGSKAMACPLRLKSYSVAGLPAAANWPACIAVASNESGGRAVVFSDGTNWRRFQDRAVVS
jgi:hypothetical protein